MSRGGHGATIPSFNASSYIASTSAGDSNHQLIHTLPAWLSQGSCGIGPPRAPWQFWQRKISAAPDLIAPNVGGSPHSQSFSQPSFSNHAKLSGKFETLRIGVIAWTFISNSFSGIGLFQRVIPLLTTNSEQFTANPS